GVHLAARVGREDVDGVPTGHAEPVVDVLLGIVGAQRFQPVEDRDALAELTQLGAGELLLELRLSDEEELDQLVALILEVGEQADLLELVALEVLRLVENQDRVVSARAGLPQEPLERRNRLGLAERAGVREPEAQADVLEQLVADRKSTRLNSSHQISYAVFCLKKKK